ncbi:hypothetical protein E4T52_01544 [Aureobasidium sp. EXF-3400]|nr:hypothetical protein E4T51_06937 [Aureobasidium sp. EXF-12344]KAI4783542.1 hypothetical protein E4T52_01544 [Aureobasidium sp. EXF-3400]
MVFEALQKMVTDEQKVHMSQDAKRTAAGIPTWSPTVQSTIQLLMYGRADGMPSFQLTVAVRVGGGAKAKLLFPRVHISDRHALSLHLKS